VSPDSAALITKQVDGDGGTGLGDGSGTDPICRVDRWSHLWLLRRPPRTVCHPRKPLVSPPALHKPVPRGHLPSPVLQGRPGQWQSQINADLIEIQRPCGLDAVTLAAGVCLSL
jgi:hypothetical protein